MKAFTTITTTIASGASLSAEISLDSWTLDAIITPDAWTTASGGTYNNLYNDGGNEVTVTAAVDRYISLIGDDKDSLGTARWLKIRSGTGASAVNQGAERTIRLVLRKDW